jgi:hypothetical protein
VVGKPEVANLAGVVCSPGFVTRSVIVDFISTMRGDIASGRIDMAHRVLAIMGILLLTCNSSAQQVTKLGHRSPKPDLQLIAAATSNEPDDAQLSVRLLNRSDHALRIPVRGFICTDMPGWISADYTFTAPANQSGYEIESGSRGCGFSVGTPAEFDIVSAVAMWKLLEPGESLDVQDKFSKLIPGSIKRGRYSSRAVYSGPALTDDEQRKLRAAGIYTALGRYESNEVIIKIEQPRR